MDRHNGIDKITDPRVRRWIGQIHIFPFVGDFPDESLSETEPVAFERFQYIFRLGEHIIPRPAVGKRRECAEYADGAQIIAFQ